MCTAVALKTKDFYFGRTLDYEFSYAEEVTVTPRNFAFSFRNGEELKSHYAIIGTAFVPESFPLYYDAVNEKGLCVAGLNFAGNAFYADSAEGKTNVAQYELIPYILGKCACVKEAARLLKRVNITPHAYGNLPVAQLHWIIADKTGAVTAESVKDGLKIYENPVGVLTNNPPFDMQLFRLNDFMNLSPRQPQNNFSDGLDLKPYSRGMGAMGLPGDLSSQSRFVRAAFTKLNSVSGQTEEESVSRFFHILGTVEQTRGCCDVGGKKYEITIYTSCCNADSGVYYYTTYENKALRAVDMFAENLNSTTLSRYPLVRKPTVVFENR